MYPASARGGDHGRTGEVALSPQPHPVLPIPVEGRNRALPLGQRVGALSEAGAAPGLADLPTHRTKHRGDGFTPQTRIGPLDQDASPCRCQGRSRNSAPFAT